MLLAPGDDVQIDAALHSSSPDSTTQQLNKTSATDTDSLAANLDDELEAKLEDLR